MVAASMTKIGMSAPVVAQSAARAPRAAAVTRPGMSKGSLFAKTERSFAQAVAGRVATVQVG
jgi:uncharacterized membrane protein YraQ (UPF0718 family)